MVVIHNRVTITLGNELIPAESALDAGAGPIPRYPVGASHPAIDTALRRAMDENAGDSGYGRSARQRSEPTGVDAR